MELMLKAAEFYHNEGLCVIPVVMRQKKPALQTWEEYHTRCSTKDEIMGWFGNGHQYNIGLVHGEVSGGYVAIDIDHDRGGLDEFRKRFPQLLSGRVEQSGSGEGYHIPLRVATLPDFGQDKKQGRPRGNRTWKTEKGEINIRCRFCQTLAPPSLHPSGKRYRFIQKGKLTEVDDLENVLCWLCDIAPDQKTLPAPKKENSVRVLNRNNLLDTLKEIWQDPIKIFQEFGIVDGIEVERNGEFRLVGNGGLLVTEDRQQWYCFADEFGGGLFEAWGWCRLGSSYDKTKHFRQVVYEMAQSAGINPQTFRITKPTQQQQINPETRINYPWTGQYKQMWERVR